MHQFQIQSALRGRGLFILPLVIAACPIGAYGASIVSVPGGNTCLEAPAGAGARSQLQLAACNGNDSQQFEFQADGLIRFKSFCVDAWGLGFDGDPIALWFCHGLSNQRWTRTSAGEIRSGNGRCINTPAGSSGSKATHWGCTGAAGQKWTLLYRSPQPAQGVSGTDACAVRQVAPSPESGLTVWSPDGTQYLVNRVDAAGIPQIYVGQKGGSPPICITCRERPNGPKPGKFKMQPRWHPSGRWIVLAAEQESYAAPFYVSPQIVEGWLQSGIWVDMYATTPDGSQWFKLQDFGPQNKADGYTGVAFTPDGTNAVWAQIVDGNVFAYGFGRWELMIAQFREVNGVPSLVNLRNITPPDTYWIEPGNFSPNGRDLLLTADQGFPNHAKVEGQDQYVLDIHTGVMTNLTKSPAIWDEHGVYSPDGEKILFMSSYPYRSEPNSSTMLGLKTEFMTMDKDGSNLRQVTHFNVPGYQESSYSGSVAANGEWSPDGKSISVLNLFFPKYKSWQVEFEGNCGARPR
ncbi:MAG: ricin-type beta-trefoil lectin domain protein [Bryobacterales bacterium]|nr:ricin-type beta-trefoil lectin domain protein [Bryobacterales bacterium]